MVYKCLTRSEALALALISNKETLARPTTEFEELVIIRQELLSPKFEGKITKEFIDHIYLIFDAVVSVVIIT
jgi:hypothetical protein